MRFWWVNHKQTHNEEIQGGYLWSPKSNKNGGRNETYLNLTRTAVNDIVFSYAHGNVMAVGRVIGPWREAARPSEFGNVGEQWDHDGWLVPIEWVPLDYPFSPRTYLSRISNLLPEKYSPIQRDTGHGNQGVYLAEISEALGDELQKLCTLITFLIASLAQRIAPLSAKLIKPESKRRSTCGESSSPLFSSSFS